MKRLIHWDDEYVTNVPSEELEKEVKISNLVSIFLNDYFEDFYYTRIYNELVSSYVFVCFNDKLELIITFIYTENLLWINSSLVQLIRSIFGFQNNSFTKYIIYNWFITIIPNNQPNDMIDKSIFNTKSGIVTYMWDTIKVDFKEFPNTFKQIKTLYPMQISESKLANVIRKILKEEGFIKNDGTLEFGKDQNDINYELVTDYIRNNKVDSYSGAGPYKDYYLPLEAREFFDFIGFKNYEVFRVDNPDHEDYGKRFVEVKSWII